MVFGIPYFLFQGLTLGMKPFVFRGFGVGNGGLGWFGGGFVRKARPKIESAAKTGVSTAWKIFRRVFHAMEEKVPYRGKRGFFREKSQVLAFLRAFW